MYGIDDWLESAYEDQQSMAEFYYDDSCYYIPLGEDENDE